MAPAGALGFVMLVNVSISMGMQPATGAKRATGGRTREGTMLGVCGVEGTRRNTHREGAESANEKDQILQAGIGGFDRDSSKGCS